MTESSKYAWLAGDELAFETELEFDVELVSTFRELEATGAQQIKT
jgi:hypothetical protein